MALAMEKILIHEWGICWERLAQHWICIRKKVKCKWNAARLNSLAYLTEFNGHFSLITSHRNSYCFTAEEIMSITLKYKDLYISKFKWQGLCPNRMEVPSPLAIAMVYNSFLTPPILDSVLSVWSLSNSLFSQEICAGHLRALLSRSLTFKCCHCLLH